MTEFLLILGLYALLYFTTRVILKLPEWLVKIVSVPFMPFITAAGIWHEKRRIALTIVILYSALYILLLIIAFTYPG
jgi:hypothetical protein